MPRRNESEEITNGREAVGRKVITAPYSDQYVYRSETVAQVVPATGQADSRIRLAAFAGFGCTAWVCLAGITEASITDAGDQFRYDRAVNPAVFFSIGGAVLIVWGSIVAIFNEWASRFMKRMQRMYGQRAADMVTPRYVRLIGICLATGGVLFLVLAFTGVLPNHVVSD